MIQGMLTYVFVRKQKAPSFKLHVEKCGQGQLFNLFSCNCEYIVPLSRFASVSKKR